MKLDAINEGLLDYAIEREEQDAREDWVTLALCALDPIDEEDCGLGAYVRAELAKAHRRCLSAGVFDDQPGEALWLTMHRRERQG